MSGARLKMVTLLERKLTSLSKSSRETILSCITTRLETASHKRLTLRKGSVGTFVLVVGAILVLVRIGGDMDFVVTHASEIWGFVSGWGIAIGVVIAGLLIAKALYETSDNPEFSRARCRLVPINEFIEVAHKSGWQFDKDGRDALGFLDGISEAGIQGLMPIYGRRSACEFTNMRTMIRPRQSIPPERWDTLTIGIDIFTTKDNIDTKITKYDNSSVEEFHDIHLDYKLASKWLKGVGKDYKFTKNKRL